MAAPTFPDGARREYPPNITGFDVAKGISPSLATATARLAHLTPSGAVGRPRAPASR